MQMFVQLLFGELSYGPALMCFLGFFRGVCRFTNYQLL